MVSYSGLKGSVEHVTCLLRTLSNPGVSPVSVFCVATGISSLSFTGGVSPLDIDLKYLECVNNSKYTLFMQPCP